MGFIKHTCAFFFNLFFLLPTCILLPLFYCRKIYLIITIIRSGYAYPEPIFLWILLVAFFAIVIVIAAQTNVFSMFPWLHSYLSGFFYMGVTLQLIQNCINNMLITDNFFLKICNVILIICIYIVGFCFCFSGATVEPNCLERGVK